LIFALISGSKNNFLYLIAFVSDTIRADQMLQLPVIFLFTGKKNIIYPGTNDISYRIYYC